MRRTCGGGGWRPTGRTSRRVVAAARISAKMQGARTRGKDGGWEASTVPRRMPFQAKSKISSFAPSIGPWIGVGRRPGEVVVVRATPPDECWSASSDYQAPTCHPPPAIRRDASGDSHRNSDPIDGMGWDGMGWDGWTGDRCSTAS